MTPEQNRRSMTHPRGHDADAGSVGQDAPPLIGLSVRVHRFVLIVLAIAGFFAGVVLGQRLFGVWGEFLGAIIGTLVVEAFVWRLIPAICPDCGHRADCVLSASSPADFHLQMEFENRSKGTVIRYHCRSCGFQLPQPVVTPEQLAAAGMSAIRVARFAKDFFTFIGGTMTIIAAAASAHGLANLDFSTASGGAAAMAFALAFTFIARRAVGGFAEAIRQGTQPSVSSSSKKPFRLNPVSTGGKIMNAGRRIEATIQTGGKTVAVQAVAPESGGGYELRGVMHYDDPDLDVWTLQIRINDEPSPRELSDGDGAPGEGFRFGLCVETPIQSAQAVWVENSEKPLGLLTLRKGQA
jgi:hypothetical protein